ncbi:MAG TPA: hypothetical protein VFF19_21905 [Reyranella sp.]|nr:hypothetical protein [Reyranella sp.]
MRHIALQAAAFLLSAFAAACGGPIASTLDREPSATELSDAADCRVQAVRQAELRYPRQPLDNPGYGVRRPAAVPDDPAKGEAAQRFFRQCMQQKARLRPSSPPSAPAS